MPANIIPTSQTRLHQTSRPSAEKAQCALRLQRVISVKIAKFQNRSLSGEKFMTIYRLTEEQIDGFAGFPEVAMGIQIAADESGKELIVAGGHIAIDVSEKIEEPLNQYRERVARDQMLSPSEYGERLMDWVAQLSDAPTLTPVPQNQALAALIHLGPRAVLPAVLPRPAYVYGHLPFHGKCGGSDIYYRYEQFPTSKRIDLKKRTVAKDTYAAPKSEERFTPTGLSAVGRFALPLVLPACWQYELTPAQGTRIFYGASVPLYGQSGGAVEVMFPDLSNLGALPALKVLPIL
ncbi:MAG: hypothetical protein ACREDY_27620 [Bradyrhizobium sp.]